MASIPSALTAGTGFLEALKKMYSPEKTKLRVELNNPTFADIKKVAIGEGQNYTYSIGLTYGSGFGNSLSAVLGGTLSGNAASGAKTANVVVNTGDDYAVLELSNKFLARAKKADAAFVEQLKYQVDASLKGLGIVLSTKLFGGGNGVISNCTNSTATAIILSPTSNVRFFTEGMVIQLLQSDSTISGNPVAITSINETTGTLTVPTPGATTGAFIGLAGMVGPTYTATNASGFSAWLPVTTPTGTTIGNTLISTSVTRANFQSQLGGFRVDDTARPIDECAYLLAQKIQERGGRPDRIICSYNTFNKMAVKAWNKIVPMNKGEATSTGVQSLGLVTPHGVIPFVVDSNMSDGACYMLTMDTWRIVHLSGALPERISDAAGNGMMFQTADDSVQIRYRAWWNLICLSPVDNGVFSVDSTNF